MSAISATYVDVEYLAGHMSLMRDHRRKGDLLVEDITTGPDWYRTASNGRVSSPSSTTQYSVSRWQGLQVKVALSTRA